MVPRLTSWLVDTRRDETACLGDSVDVSEVQILPIRQISERGGVEVASFEAPFLLGLDLVASTILGLHQDPEGGDDADFEEVTHNHAPNAQLVPRGLVGLVEERPRDVAGTIPQEQNGVGDDLFGVARGVCDLQGQNHDERGVVRPREQITKIPPDVVLLVDEAEAKRTGDVGAEKDQNEEASPVGESIIQEDAGQDGQDDEAAVRDLHQRGDQGGKAEAFDDQRAEIRDPPVGHVAHHAEGEEEVEFDVGEGFFDLIRL